MDWMNKAERWDWIGLEEKDRKQNKEESDWKRNGPEEKHGRIRLEPIICVVKQICDKLAHSTNKKKFSLMPTEIKQTSRYHHSL